MEYNSTFLFLKQKKRLRICSTVDCIVYTHTQSRNQDSPQAVGTLRFALLSREKDDRKSERFFLTILPAPF